MTEQDLINLDFKKVIVKDEESDNGYDYHYFRKYISGVYLAADYLNKEGKLHVHVDELGIVIKDINLVKELINVFSKIENAKRKVSVSKENG